MRFDTDVHDSEALSFLDRLVTITGSEPWEKKFGTLEDQLRKNPFLLDYQRERHGLELTFRDSTAQSRKTGVFTLSASNQNQYSLVAFAASLVRIFESLSPRGKTRLRGMLLDGLKPDNNLLSLQHEITTATHLVSRGFDIDLHDLENGRGVDFIAKQGSLEVEIECKMFTADIGRRIHKRKVLILHHKLAGAIRTLFKSAKTGLLVRITIPDRLTCRPDELDTIVQAVSRGLVNGYAVTNVAGIEVQVLDFPIAGSPFDVDDPAKISRHGVEQLLRARLGRSNKNLMIVFSPRKRAVVVLVESVKRDEVLKGIHRQLRESCKGQFTKTRPGHVCVQLHGLTAEEMETLARDGANPYGEAVALQVMTTHLLQSRTHIYSVAFRSHGSLLRMEDQSLMERGVQSFTRNPLNPFHDDPRLMRLH